MSISNSYNGGYNDAIVLRGGDDPCDFKVSNVKITKLESFSNNNHGQIYSGRALEFDGVSDYLDTNYTWTSNTVSICAWVNADALSGNSVITGNRTAGNDGVTIMMDSDEKIRWEAGASEVLTTSSYLNQWIRICAVYDKANTLMSLYLNGELYGTTTTDLSLANITGSGSRDIVIGSNRVTLGTNLFIGKISDVQWWDAAFTASDALYDYLNPEQLALNRGGTSLTESNLKLWYPMNDGHRGQQSYILDASNTGLSDELLNNADFSSYTEHTGTIGNSNISGLEFDDWGEQGGSNGSTGSGAYTLSTIPNGFRAETTIAPSNGWFHRVYQELSSTLAVGKTYKLTFEIKANRTGAFVASIMEGDSTNKQTPDSSIPALDTFESSTHYFTCTATGSQGLYFWLNNPVPGEYYEVRNVSLQAINDKNHATTVFYGDELNTQANAVTPEHSSASEADDYANWTNVGMANFGSQAANVTQGAKSLRMDVNGNGDLAHTNFTTTIVGRTYRFQWDWLISNHDADNRIEFKIGTSADDDTNGSIVSYTENTGTSQVTGTYKDFVATATTTFFTCREDGDGNDADLYLDNLSLKEIGTATGWTDADQQLNIPQTALQSYNQLAWFDGAIGDVDLDSQIDTDANDWSLSFWIYFKDQGDSFIFPIGDTSTKNIVLKKTTTDLGLYYRDEGASYHILSSSTGASGPIQENQWLHIIVTADGDTSMKGYINGELNATNSDMTSTHLQLQNFMNGHGSYFTLGTINEISYYNDILTQTEVNDLYNDGKAKSALDASGSGGLVGYWRNNGLSEWKDLKGSNDANPSNVTETMLITAGADGSRDSQGFLMNRQRATNCLNFKDDNNTATPFSAHYLKLGQNPLSNLTDDFSVSLWVNYHDDYTSYHTFLLLGESSTSHVHIGKEQGTEINISYEPGNGVTSRPRTATGHLEQDGWTHIVVCFSTGTHTGSDNASVLTDSAANWTADELIDGWVHRLQSSTHNYVADITDNDSTTVTGSLDSGDYDTDDKYNIIKIYVDGDPVAVGAGANEDSGNPDTPTTADSYYVGHSPSHNRAFIGQIDDLIIYSKWLTAAEVKRNYNAGKRSHR